MLRFVTMSGWGNWVPASAVRNWFEGDTLLDWLNVFGEDNAFVPDNKRSQYDSSTDFAAFVMSKSRAFERRIVELLRERCEVAESPHEGERGLRDYYEKQAIDTAELIGAGAELIYQGVLMDPATKLYGRPDLIVRSDVLPRLVDAPPKRLPSETHYRIVDIKYTSIDLTAPGFVGNSGDRYRKAQLLAYSRGLAAVQGTMPSEAYILARSYTHKDERINNSLAMLAPAEMNEGRLALELDEAANWIRRLRAEGEGWSVLPAPSVEELRPHMTNIQDYPWHSAKKEINEEIKDLTSLWYVSPKVRRRAVSRGVTRYDDEKCCAQLFELGNREQTLHCIIESQRPDTPNVSPERITTERDGWHTPRPLEFYVDFETVSDLDDDFSKLPNKGGQPLIFMIGCGHIEEGVWKFECFVADKMTEPAEKEVIDAWIEHMVSVSARFVEKQPFVFHWSPHERSSLTTAFNAARVRHPDNNWPEPNWYDFLTRVVRKEPVTVKGALAFGLKAVAKALHYHDLIRTRWTDGPGDGLQAMVGGWWCGAEAERQGCCMLDLELMKQIRDYNEVDCRVMWEAISYLRANH